MKDPVNDKGRDINERHNRVMTIAVIYKGIRRDGKALLLNISISYIINDKRGNISNEKKCRR